MSGQRWATATERFHRRITMVPAPEGVTGPCWQWDVLRPASGYGDIFDGSPWLVHRWSYTQFVGPIPDGLEIDHLCRNRGCANPEHLEPVTSSENTRRGHWGMRTHCSHGHEYTPENTRRIPSYRGRVCVTCRRERAREQYAKSGDVA